MSFSNNSSYYNESAGASFEQQGSSTAAVATSAAVNYSSEPSGGHDSAAQSYEGYSSQEPSQFNLNSIQLPPPNASCYQPPGDMRGTIRHVKHDDQSESKNIEQTFNDTKTATRENIVHHQHNKNVIYNVNRNHNHLIKVVNKDSNFHHHLINNIVRVNDIHHQRIEQVRGEGRTSRDFKQTHRVEAGGCRRGQDSGDASSYSVTAASSSGATAAVVDDSSSVAHGAAAAWQQQVQSNASNQWQQSSSATNNGYAAQAGSYNYNGGNYNSNASGPWRRY